MVIKCPQWQAAVDVSEVWSYDSTASRKRDGPASFLKDYRIAECQDIWSFPREFSPLGRLLSSLSLSFTPDASHRIWEICARVLVTF